MNHNKNEHPVRFGETHSDDAQQIVDRIVSELKAKRIRITEPRKAIITYMVESHSHPTAEEIYEDLLPDNPGMSLATVYNNLNTLIEQGYVHEMKFAGITSRYDFMGHQHFHIICEKCGKVADFPARDITPIKDDAYEHTGYQVRGVSLEMFGICPNCQTMDEGVN
ncbi:transcriptional repressor [Tuanshanicoccus lijuaniae]|uniref:Fur family transcriptional regulator n=1 Tax=Aerococcaceae bacterium zg-1292 TaxID=2774330 RepID=UPI00193894C2|nr:transcriptional repressor [Aerococcaceae bacterium zg-1292]MBF6625832.1 transcriptional repressor [Aerococcaceae bacterium zg-BR9]MBF6978607.1 transcriptional repressor [Aerococcaceae bacterium zg-BR22]MBS4455592.1 transcriptional repressor [Aerococcaceae bacterium zg-A91]MBS4457211.1 transcriptional repressor [Aerococcaceae bacterium zg-BR33]